MSAEAITEFFRKVEEDSTMQKEFNVTIQTAARIAIVLLASSHGYKFTAEELLDYTADDSRGLSDEELDALVRLAGLAELSEMASLRLQMTMDRRSKFIAMLSNIMKRISTTQETLIQNIK